MISRSLGCTPATGACQRDRRSRRWTRTGASSRQPASVRGGVLDAQHRGEGHREPVRRDRRRQAVAVRRIGECDVVCARREPRHEARARHRAHHAGPVPRPQRCDVRLKRAQARRGLLDEVARAARPATAPRVRARPIPRTGRARARRAATDARCSSTPRGHGRPWAARDRPAGTAIVRPRQRPATMRIAAPISGDPLTRGNQ